jgi:hypothetical protein
MTIQEWEELKKKSSQKVQMELKPRTHIDPVKGAQQLNRADDEIIIKKAAPAPKKPASAGKKDTKKPDPKKVEPKKEEPKKEPVEKPKPVSLGEFRPSGYRGRGRGQYEERPAAAAPPPNVQDDSQFPTL